VARRCRQVVVEVPKAMQPLLAQAGFENLVAQDSVLPPFDVQVSLASLPHLFGTTLETIPADVPYLKVDQRLLDAWRGELAAYDGFKVGIVWQGRPTFGGDRYRSMPLSCFAPLAEVPGVRLFSLQKGAGTEQISALQEAFEVVDLGSRVHCDVGDFMDTAAAMKNLDLVVSADTGCAHLAGALGVPVWVALRFSAEWRWMRDRTDSPWYPTMRLFRQTTLGDWAGVFRAMAAELQQEVKAKSG
jgi:Glycosyltransferase family 9 (heptosyltransferase)